MVRGGRVVLLSLMLLTGGLAQAQVVVHGDVYGGCKLGQVKRTDSNTRGNATVIVNDGTVGDDHTGSVFGGGQGSLDDENAGAVRGNTTVTINGGTVVHSVYGGGEQGPVGTFTESQTFNYAGGASVAVPTACAENTGIATVNINNGMVGRSNQALMPHAGTALLDDDFGYVFCGGRGEVDSVAHPKAIALGVVGSTVLNIGNATGGKPLITASAYGGSENGMVLGNTKITVKSGQIGVGHYKTEEGGVWIDHFDGLYTDTEWADAIDAVQDGTIGTTYVNPFHECDAWPYEPANYFVYDVFADPSDPELEEYAATAIAAGGNVYATDGHSFFGNLFGGGSGYYPYAPGQWRRSAGRVKGNTEIDIQGGHILTSVYAGNETTDIIGKSTVNMSGGTIGVPRTLEQIQAHPVTCYLFGGGMGDPRTYFNKWTNVSESEINITGGTIFGSVFGGGEEGHVLGDVAITINKDDGNTLIGTLGYSYVDGNVFGAGRGLSGMSLTAGSVGGNVTVNIEDGTMLGSVYGGGRLASVGTYLVPDDDPNYGQFQEGDSYGHVTINISGGIIGNDNLLDNGLSHPHGGNVFGGSMGRLKDVNNANYLPLWHRLARVKETHVNITGGTIKNIVYGGSEYGSVRDKTSVIVNDPSIYIRKVYGGGYGSDIIDAGYVSDSAAYPALLAGRVEGNTLVEIKAGTIGTNVYGGGDLATVGVVKSDGTLVKGTAKVTVTGGYIGNATLYSQAYDPNIPATHADHTGHVFGGGQGNETDYSENFKRYCNVNNTEVRVQGGTIYGSVFGGGAESHVLGNTNIYVTGGNIGTQGLGSWDGDVFGGGKGNGQGENSSFVASKTMGRVGGNTYVEVSGGSLKGSIFGGGRIGSVGIDENGNPYLNNGAYANATHGMATVKVSGTASTSGGNTTYSTIIGTDNYHDLLFSDESVGDVFGGGKGDTEYYNDIFAGRVGNTVVEITGTPMIRGDVFGGGEMASVGYWNASKTFYANSGVTSVTLGTEDENDNPIIGTQQEFTYYKHGVADSEPNHNPGQWTVYELLDPSSTTNTTDFRITHTATGNIYGGCQGDDDYTKPHWISMARSHTANVTIYQGTIMGSVFGGSEQGTMAGNTNVTIYGGTIGQALHSEQTLTPYHFGSVFGGGYGSPDYEHNSNDSTAYPVKIAGRTYGNATVNIFGGHIYDNVYGGGDLASVGWVKSNGALMGGLCTVNVGTAETASKAIIGELDGTGLNAYVYGGSKGVSYDPVYVAVVNSVPVQTSNYEKYCNVNETAVTVNLAYINPSVGWNSATDGRVYGSLFGGSPDGHVIGDARITLKGGLIGTNGTTSWDGNIFGGGRNYYMVNYTSGRVGGNVYVTMDGGTLQGSIFGGGRNAITGCGESYYAVNSNGQYTVMQPGRDHGNIEVTVSGGTVGNADVIRNHTTSSMGDVYGGGKGNMTGIASHPAYSALLTSLTKNTTVTIKGDAHILGSVFGGGEVACVGNYGWNMTNTGAVTNIRLIDEGLATVKVEGDAVIGPDRIEMNCELQEGTTNFDLKYNTDRGHVFGGGEGLAHNPEDYDIVNENSTVGHSNVRLLDIMASVGSTNVTIGTTTDKPWVKGSVFGGSENGHVLGNTVVTINSGQIGAGDNTVDDEDELYDNDDFVNPLEGGITTSNSLYTTTHWDYEASNRPFDPAKLKADYTANHNYNNSKPTDGKTWYGNVYGGGSGYYPYVKETSTGSGVYEAIWNTASGQVEGTASVTINGGHILTSVYGGGEIASVGMYTVTSGDVTFSSTQNPALAASTTNPGRATITMTGGTVGVPRTTEDIKDYPLFSNLFGGGKGGFHTSLRTHCNVGSTSVSIEGGIIYGSALGGPEDGHVIGNASIAVSETNSAKPTIIGSSGMSGVDGHVFGGGRNFNKLTYTAGRVGGNTTVQMTGGQALGCVYGGGRFALVGIDALGNMKDDIADDPNTTTVNEAQKFGSTLVQISGGILGNTLESTTDPGNRIIETFSEFSMGSVYGGGKGDLVGIEGHPAASVLLVGLVKNTDVRISDNARIWGIVFGGGELANVGKYTWDQSGTTVTNIDVASGTGLSKVKISGGIIGADRAKMRYEGGDDPSYAMYPKYNDDLGYVYGGGEGLSDDPTNTTLYPVLNTAHYGNMSLLDLLATVNNTEVTIEGGLVKASVFGGAESGHVMGNTLVTIRGGQIGAGNNTDEDKDELYDDDQFINPTITPVTTSNCLYRTVHWDYGIVDPVTNEKVYAPYDPVDVMHGTIPSDGKTWFGNVFGGGSGWFPYITGNGTTTPFQSNWNPNSGKVWGDTRVVIEGGHILSTVYGANEATDVGGDAYITMSGGTVGVPRTTGQLKDHPIGGGVFGGGAGDPRTKFDGITNVQNTNVQITGGIIYASVFGGSEDGHVLGNTTVSVGQASGKTTVIGCSGLSSTDGNIFGGGRNFIGGNMKAGRVAGNTTVTMSGGHIQGSVYGGGRLGQTGVGADGTPVEFITSGAYDGEHHGLATINITGGIIGNAVADSLLLGSDESVGDVFGSGKGDTKNYQNVLAGIVANTQINISGNPTIYGGVWGGGEMAGVGFKNGEYLYTNKNFYENTGASEVNISGNPVIGIDREYEMAYMTDHSQWTTYETDANGVQRLEHTCTGNVYGGSQGDVDLTDPSSNWPHMAYSRTATVTINMDNEGLIKSNVYGGPEQGTMTENATVKILGGTIGQANLDASDGSKYSFGSVFGGGYGHATEIVAGHVYGSSSATVGQGSGKTTLVQKHVFGGGDLAIVDGPRTANIEGGTVKEFVLGGNNKLSGTDRGASLKTVNVRGGHIEGSVFGGSYIAEEGNAPTNTGEWGSNRYWTSFINITGGTIGDAASGHTITPTGNVYAAGYGGSIHGSVCVNIGLTAVKNPVISDFNTQYQNGLVNSNNEAIDPTPAKLKIMGDVFDGSYQYETNGTDEWDHDYDISGYSVMFIDGSGYDTKNSETANVPENDGPYMNMFGGIYGSGNYCESGELGRKVVFRNYGERVLYEEGPNAGQMKQATRTLTTFQRGGITLIDNSNINFTGAPDISQQWPDRNFGFLTVDEGLYVTNGSSFVLGTNADSDFGTPSVPAYMDSIHAVKSLYLKDGLTSYDEISSINPDHYEMVGINANNNTLYRIQANNTTTALSAAQENVIIFNDDSRMWVRYKEQKPNDTEKKTYYGELNGFFRMRADNFTVHGTESFAYARPKLTQKVNPIAGYNTGNGDTWNAGDGGFLSFNNLHNNFPTMGQMVLEYTYPETGNDGGSPYTNTWQYPYYNMSEVVGKGDTDLDMWEYREWVVPIFPGKIWYVDGRGIGNGGWGKDGLHVEHNKPSWGHYPDKPKLTITGTNGIYNDRFNEHLTCRPFDAANDVIFVVGPVEALKEEANLNLSMLDADQTKHYSLKLYRYPGGHTMSNGRRDCTAGNPPVPASSYDGLDNTTVMDQDHGPGANYDAMILVNKPNTNFVLDNVSVDGVYREGNFNDSEILEYGITNYYDKLNVSEPMVLTSANTTLTLKGGTVLQHGYNNNDASTTWYPNPDYPTTADGLHHGALYVDENATVNMEGLVTITGNKQKNGSTTTESNVYLPTFAKSLTITDAMDVATRIGVTSPMRNTATDYRDNTLSPVAMVDKSEATSAANGAIASTVWSQGNFLDDQDWFFGNGGHTTYYDNLGYEGVGNEYRSLYFGWTWANVVREAPSEFDVSNIDSKEDLAWLISLNTGMNGATATNFSGQDLLQKTDLDMSQYVWVPIGDANHNELGHNSFAGHFDGQGHLIKNINIDYIGRGDTRYEHQDYGLFGHVDGSVERTFVVSGKVNPKVSIDLTDTEEVNIGGLVGGLQNATVTSSEAALHIDAPDEAIHKVAAGGLVAKMLSGGEVHSSMAMPEVETTNKVFEDPTTSTIQASVGGLVGNATTGGKVYNSFVNAKFTVHGTPNAGGLMGSNDGASVENCYVAFNNTTTKDLNFDGLVGGDNYNGFDSCYVMADYPYMGQMEDHGHHFTATNSSDRYGYMYRDNTVKKSATVGAADTAMFRMLNHWVDERNKATGNENKYARWSRPGLSEINGDYPVLLLNDMDRTNAHQGNFSTVATISDIANVLQYGGMVRDANQLDGAIERMVAGSAKDVGDALFIYGDITTAPTENPASNTKISIQEDVAIMDPGTLSSYDNTYVGITFDNSFGKATATPGMNGGLYGADNLNLNRDWHMFSTPLSNAPLGFDYKNQNEANLYTNGNYSNTNFFNNPWVGPETEFSWITTPTNSEVYTAENLAYRYWMKSYETADGYFPTTRDYTFRAEDNVSDWFIENSDECPSSGHTFLNRYPYGMDFYTWNEPEYHWINFKRNGPNHWHSDANSTTGLHDHLDYVPVADAPANVNETNLIVGRGYMASIASETFMQSHGRLNATDGGQSIMLTKTEDSKLPGWNLVGNPYHGYLDFDVLGATTGPNSSVLANHMTGDHNDGAFYVIYDADKYQNRNASTAYRYYPVDGSGEGGDYADQYLHPHQGFYVKTTTDRSVLQISESMLKTRVDASGSQFRSTKPSYPLVNLYLNSDKGCADVTVIEFERPEWGGARKVKELRVGDGLFYAHHGDAYYAALFAKEGVDRVPLWFEAKEDDIFTMKWNTANGDFNSMYLIDNITGVQYDMLRNDTYTFEGHKEDYPSRFLIVFNLTDVEEFEEDKTHTFAFFDGSEWVVTGDGDLEFIDMLGRVLAKSHISGQGRVTLPMVADGPYLFRLTNSKETRIQKVIVTK